jgi:hypothetical protein
VLTWLHFGSLSLATTRECWEEKKPRGRNVHVRESSLATHAAARTHTRTDLSLVAAVETRIVAAARNADCPVYLLFVAPTDFMKKMRPRFISLVPQRGIYILVQNILLHIFGRNGCGAAEARDPSPG